MRSTFTLLCFCLSLFTHAQIQRGDQIITLKEPVSVSASTPLFNAPDFGEMVYVPAQHYGRLDLSPTYGFALTDRLVVGSNVSVGVGVDEDGWRGQIGLGPYLRYYAVNREDIGLYGQVGTELGLVGGRVPGVTIINEGFYGFKTASLRAGLQLPLGPDVRFGPVLDYQIESGGNVLSLGAQIEIVLSSGRGGEAAPVDAFRAGAVMLGGQLAEVTIMESFVSGALRLGGHYFLTDRVAAGLSFGAGGSRLGQQFVRKGLVLSTDLSIRYYVTTENRLVWYAEAGGGYLSGRQWNSGQIDSPIQSGRYFTLSAAVGGQYFLRDNIALEFGPKWREVLDDAYTGEGIDLNIGARFLLR